MSVYITGDTHGDFSQLRDVACEAQLTKGDILIICGDFGFDWDEKTVERYKNFEKDFTVLFCDGNHENYDILDTLPQVEMFGDVVGDFGNDTYRLLTGHMYTIEGKKIFTFGGASSIDKQWRIEKSTVEAYGKLWWEQEVPTMDKYYEAVETLKANNYKFDYFISHTCKPGLKLRLLDYRKLTFDDPVEDMIENLEALIYENGGEWSDSYFGHFHLPLNYGKYHCLYYNVTKLF